MTTRDVRLYVKELLKQFWNKTKNYIDEKINYSEQETVVGTWVDGKPIYQKTIVVESSVSLTNAGYRDVFTVPVDIKKVINIKSDYQTMLYLAYPNEANVGQWAMAGAYGVVIPAGTNITLQYTKTTDIVSE